MGREGAHPVIGQLGGARGGGRRPQGRDRPLTAHPATGGRRAAAGGPRVGFYGVLGSGNLGNDGSLEAVVGYLRRRHPDAELGFMCMGPDVLSARYGVPATHLQWYEAHTGHPGRVASVPLKILGRLLDTFRTPAWVRRYDVVVVPGMGVLEATVPLRPWAFPYSLFLLCASGRLVGTRVALVGVGADATRKRATRWLIARAARMAHYRSYRDAYSRDVLRRLGVDVAADEVYAELAFALEPPVAPPAGATGVVGVGVMAFRGDNDDRGRGDELHAHYLDTVKRFVRWLVARGHQVRLFTGDREDEGVVAEILADLRSHQPGLEPSRVVAEPAATLPELMRRMAAVDAVVATRYHNVVAALRLAKPTVSISYAAKNDVLMAAMGLGDFCQPARSVDLDLLVEQFTGLQRRAEDLRRTLAERNREVARRLADQFTALSAEFFPADPPAPVARGERLPSGGEAR